MDSAELPTQVTQLTQQVNALMLALTEVKEENQTLIPQVTRLSQLTAAQPPEPKINPPLVFTGDRKNFVNSIAFFVKTSYIPH